MKETIQINDFSIDKLSLLSGSNDKHFEIIEEQLEVEISMRGDIVTITGTDPQNIKEAKDVIEALINLIKKGIQVHRRDVIYALRLENKNDLESIEELYKIKIARTLTGKLIYPKTFGQKEYYHALQKNDIVFGIGPAGTGKTYLGVVFAVNALKNNEVQKIILTRPAVEAGESLGFLPGDLKEKVDPYLRPLYDALYDMLGFEQTEKLIEKGVIEIAPLAYMRGRTLEDAYVILDEAQNTTKAQMKMFLTRLGFNSKMIVTGDISQIDLPWKVDSGLKEAAKLLSDVKGIKFVYLSPMDVVRHPVVQRVIEKYDSYEK